MISTDLLGVIMLDYTADDTAIITNIHDLNYAQERAKELHKTLPLVYF